MQRFHHGNLYGEKKMDKAAGGENPGRNFDLMVEARVGKDLEAGACRAAFGIVRSINKAWYPRLNHRSRAHAAGFDSDVQGCARQPVIVHNSRGLPKNDDFRVGRRVAIANRTVAGARDDSVIKRQHGPDGHFLGRRSGTRFLESFLHEADVEIHIG